MDTDRRLRSSTDPESTIDLLLDSRFRKDDDWFGDASFGFRGYAFGSLRGKPSHCPDHATVEADVVRAVQEAEDCSSSDEEEDDVEALRKAKSGKEASVLSMVRRLAAKPSMVAIRFLGWSLSKVWRAAFSSIYLHNAEVAMQAIAKAKGRPGTAFIILPTHRSHADYLLMSYIFFGLDCPVPLIAAGDNLNVPLLGGLLARAGAFFIRRSSSTPRYRLVLQAYMHELAKSGVPIEFFIEGGRSRRGHVGKPKVGLLGMIVQMVRDGDLKDAVLLPVSLDYDCVPEGNGFANEVLGTQKNPESLFGTIKAAIEWMLWGKRHGGVYIGFADHALSVNEMILKLSKQQSQAQSRVSSSSSLVIRTSSPFDPTILSSLTANRERKRKSNFQSSESAKAIDANEEKRKLHVSHQLHHHHVVPPPAAIFRGGSNTSLAASVFNEDTLAHDIGRLVAEAQRESALITVGGVASCALLMASQDSGDLVLEKVQRRAATLVQLLLELGHGHRIPDGTLNSVTMDKDIDSAVDVLGGTKSAAAGASSRLCLRYAAAPVIIRLLPAFVYSLGSKPYSPLHVWLCGMYDIELDPNGDDDTDDDQGEHDEFDLNGGIKDLISIHPDLPRELCALIAPLVYILAATLDKLPAWKLDAIVSEEDASQIVRDALVDADKFPEMAAPLEIAAAFKAGVICKVLKRTTTTNKAGKKVTAYELEPTYAAPLTMGRSALADARKKLDETRKIR